MLTEDEKIAAVAAALLGSVNAPEQEIWKVSRAIVAMVSAEFAGEIERLQKIIDSRPAINAALPQSYIDWSQSIYEIEAVQSGRLTSN
jgi:hypothetical protein